MMRLTAIICLLTAAAASALGGEIRHTLSLDPSQIVADTVSAPDGTQYLRLWAPDCDYAGEPGEPMIPCKRINFLVPTYSNNFSVRIDNVTTSESRTLGLPLYPVQEPQTVNDYDPEKFTPLSESLTTSNNKFEAMLVDEYFANGDNHIISVALNMLGVDYSKSSMNLYSSIDLTLTYSDCNLDDIAFRPVSVPTTYLDIDLQSMVVNPPDQGFSGNRKTTSQDSPQEAYYILVPDNLKKSVSNIVKWKQQKGLSVIVKTFDEIVEDPEYAIGSRYDIFDPESSVRSWLQSEYVKNGNFNLLIIGNDESGAPIRKFRVNDRYAEEKSYYNYDGENYIPSDAYFSDMVSHFTFNKEPNGYYTTLVDDAPYSPTLSVGRLLADKPEHIDNYSDKLIIYELDPGLGDPSYLNRGVVSKQYQFRNSISIFDALADFPEVVELIDSMNVKDYETSQPIGKEVIDEMGLSGLFSLKGHGSPVSIAVSGKSGSDWDDYLHYRYIQAIDSYTLDDLRVSYTEAGNGLDNLNNRGKPSIFYTFSCDVTPFDNIDFVGGGKRSVNYNMGSAFTVAGDFGGPAFIGNTRLGWSPTSSTLEYSFGKQITKGASIGSALNLSGLELPVNEYNKSIPQWARFTRNIIGDPELKIWLKAPEKMDVDVEFVETELVLRGQEVYGSKVVIADGRGNSKVFTFEDNRELVSIPFSDFNFVNGNHFIVSVFKDGKLPFVKMIGSNSSVMNSDETFFLSEANLECVNENEYMFNVSASGMLNLNCTQELSSNRGFKIDEMGSVLIKASKKIKLEGDQVSSQGNLTANAPEVVLDKGFCVEKGGTLLITSKK